MAKKRLTGKDFRKKRSLKTEDVHIDEWDGFVTVREMSAVERDEFDEFILNMREKNKVQGVRSVVVAITAVDEDGKRMFSDLDVPDLGKNSAKIIGKISDVGMRLSGLSEEDVEETVKNSETVPESDSSSDSVKS